MFLQALDRKRRKTPKKGAKLASLPEAKMSAKRRIFHLRDLSQASLLLLEKNPSKSLRLVTRRKKHRASWISRTRNLLARKMTKETTKRTITRKRTPERTDPSRDLTRAPPRGLVAVVAVPTAVLHRRKPERGGPRLRRQQSYMSAN